MRLSGSSGGFWGPRHLAVQESAEVGAYPKAITDLFLARGVLRY